MFMVILIFAGVTVAWMVLGTSMLVRTEMLDNSLSREMTSLWGPKVLAQSAPYWSLKSNGGRSGNGAVTPSSSQITADIKHEHRYKGLLWYSTFTVKFSGQYTIPKAESKNVDGYFIFPLPERTRTLDGLAVMVDNQPVQIPTKQKESGVLAIKLNRSNGDHTVSVNFVTYGLNVWLYVLGDVQDTHGRYASDRVVPTCGQMSELKDFSLTISTDFRDIDYPKGTRSPKKKATASSDGMVAKWNYNSLITNQAMGVSIPQRVNAGPVVVRMSFFAPVSLFFFFTALFTLVVLKKIPLHPMHYLLISAAFFAFHILLAYLVDHINIHAAFWICAATSVFLVVSYMRLVAGVKFAISYVALAQLVYLVGFSYAFFWVGKTGLTVTIGAIVTLFVLMQATGKVNWQEVFKKRPSAGWTIDKEEEPVVAPPIKSKEDQSTDG